MSNVVVSTDIRGIKNVKGIGRIKANYFSENKVAKNKSPFLCITFSEDDNSLSLNIWSNDSKYETLKNIEDNSLVEAEIEYKGVSKGYDQYVLHNIKKIERPSLIDCVDIKKLQDELKNILQHNVPDDEIRAVLYDVCANKELLNKLFLAPASEKSSYSFKGGTLAHIVRTCKLCIAICDIYDNWNLNKGGFNEKLNLSALIFASFMSEIGNVESFELTNNGVQKTFKGKLNESSYYTSKIMNEYLIKSDMPEEKKLMLEHIVTSSKGKLVYGALNTPRTKEAVVFHQIERMDKLVGGFEYLERISLGGEFGKIGDKEYCILDIDDI